MFIERNINDPERLDELNKSLRLLRNEIQKELAEQSSEALKKSGRFQKPLATEIVKASNFSKQCAAVTTLLCEKRTPEHVLSPKSLAKPRTLTVILASKSVAFTLIPPRILRSLC